MPPITVTANGAGSVASLGRRRDPQRCGSRSFRRTTDMTSVNSGRREPQRLVRCPSRCR